MTVGAIAEVMWTARAALLKAAARARWPQHRAMTAILAELTATQAAMTAPAPGPLAAAVDAFGLDAAETAALALVAAVEIDVRHGALLAVLQGVADALRPTVGTLIE